jgi:hypothetical protein
MDPGRAGFIRRMAALAGDEPQVLHDGDDLIERTLQYAGTAVPRVTREEVLDVLGTGQAFTVQAQDGTVLECDPQHYLRPGGEES